MPVRAVAAPVKIGQRTVAALSAAGPRYRIDAEREQSILQHVIEQARAASKDLDELRSFSPLTIAQDATRTASTMRRPRGLAAPQTPWFKPHQKWPTMSDAQTYIDQMATSRGYGLNYHKVMAAADFPTLQATNDLVNAAHLSPRLLDAQTKELLFILSLTVIRAPKPQLKSHIEVGLDLGLSPQEILDAIEIALPEAGVVAFQYGVEAWAEVVGAERLEPTVNVHTGTGN